MPPDESITYVTQNIKINLFKSFTIDIYFDQIKEMMRNMGTESDNRKILVNLVERMNELDIQKLIAYASGYEAGKISQHTFGISEQSIILETQ